MNFSGRLRNFFQIFAPRVKRKPQQTLRRRLGTIPGMLTVWWMGVALTALFLALTTRPAKAEIHLSGEVNFELQNDRTYRSSDRDAHINDLYFTIEPSLSLEFFDGFSLEAAGVLEPVFDPEGHKNRWIDDHGFFIEELYLKYSFDRYTIRAGKFNPLSALRGISHREFMARISRKTMRSPSVSASAGRSNWAMTKSAVTYSSPMHFSSIKAFSVNPRSIIVDIHASVTEA